MEAILPEEAEEEATCPEEEATHPEEEATCPEEANPPTKDNRIHPLTLQMEKY